MGNEEKYKSAENYILNRIEELEKENAELNALKAENSKLRDLVDGILAYTHRTDVTDSEYADLNGRSYYSVSTIWDRKELFSKIEKYMEENRCEA